MGVEQSYSITRTKATWKPRVNEADLPFLHHGPTGSIFQFIQSERRASFSDPGRNPVNELPYTDLPSKEALAEAGFDDAAFISAEDAPEGFTIDYAIVGGYNNNCIKVTWTKTNQGESPVWVALKTFTGMQTKYILPKKPNSVLFALAEDDAYVYCDKDPCLECIFMCKRGFVVYAYLEGAGIVRLPLERAEANYGRK